MSKTIVENSDDLQLYIKDIKKIPVITHERQDQIFNLLQDSNITKRQKEKLLDELVTGNLRFVISVAKMYQNQGLPLNDLINEGNIGLIKAATRFKPESGLRFISYAVWWVKQSIIASLNEYSRTIRVPSNVLHENQKEKRDRSNDEFNFKEDHNGFTGAYIPHCVSLDSDINEDGDQLIELIPNRNADNPESALDTKEEIKKRVSLMLGVLDEREKTIIERYFGLNGIESNLDDLGEEFGCTKERIRQLKDKSLKKLRNESYLLFKYL